MGYDNIEKTRPVVVGLKVFTVATAVIVTLSSMYSYPKCGA